MPSVTLGFGADDDPFFVDPDATTEHFVGSSTYFPTVDYTPLIEANSSLTNTGALGSDDTATYATADQGGLRDDFTAAYAPRTPPHLFVKGRLSEAYTLPETVSNLTLSLIGTARTTWAHTSWLISLTLYDAAGGYVWQLSQGTPSSTPATSAWNRYVVGGWNVTSSAATLRTGLAARRATLLISPGGYDQLTVVPDGLDEVAFLGIRLAWDDPEPTELPILRVHPRSDGRGLSSARRVWPPNKVSQDHRWLPYGGGYR